MDVPDTVSIRADLEATRAAYHELLASLSDADWHRRSGNPSLTVKQLMWHMAWSMTFMAGAVDGVLRSRSFNPPSFLVEPARLLAMRWLARRATPEAAARKYDDGHAALLARLDALRDAGWSRSVQRFGEQRDAAWYFRHAAQHFAEHAAGRAGGGVACHSEPFASLRTGSAKNLAPSATVDPSGPDPSTSSG